MVEVDSAVVIEVSDVSESCEYRLIAVCSNEGRCWRVSTGSLGSDSSPQATSRSIAPKSSPSGSRT